MGSCTRRPGAWFSEIAATVTPAAAAGLTTAAPATAPTLRYATPAQTNLDGNTVDMDRERASFADNAVRYEATLRFINGSLRTLHDAMKSHNAA